MDIARVGRGREGGGGMGVGEGMPKRLGEEGREDREAAGCMRRRWHQCLNSVDSKRKLFQPGGRPSWEHGGGQTAPSQQWFAAAHFLHMRAGSWVQCSATNSKHEPGGK